MPPSKRQREAARRRRAEELAVQAATARRRRRHRAIGLVIVGALVIALGVSATLALGDRGGSDESPTPAEPSAAERAQDETEGASESGSEAETGPSVEPTPAPEIDPLVPDPALAEARTWTGALETNRGEISIELDGAAAPQAVANFVTLAEDGFFDGTKCHRLVTSGIHVLQCGDPTASGLGGPGYTWGPIENAPADDMYPAGTIAMARVGYDGFSMGSQFFLVYEDSPILSDSAGGYTVFGQITSGLDVLLTIADEGNGDDGVAPKSDVIIEGVLVQ